MTEGVGVDGGVLVVAVATERNVARGLVAGDHGLGGVAVAVTIPVEVPGLTVGGVLVDLAVAVLVDLVAAFGSAGVDVRVVVDAVEHRAERVLGGEAIAIAIGRGAGGEAEAEQGQGQEAHVAFSGSWLCAKARGKNWFKL